MTRPGGIEDEKPGWIKLYRKATDSSVFQNMSSWYVWTWCLMKANHRDKTFKFNGRDITVKRGSFVTGREKACAEMPEISAQRYRTAINYLKSTNRITTISTNKYTIITICKYDEYQGEELQVNQQKNAQITNHQPTTNQRLTTTKNDKKIYIGNPPQFLNEDAR